MPDAGCPIYILNIAPWVGREDLVSGIWNLLG